MKHPLLNKNSKHYDQQKIPTIEKIEKELTLQEAIGFAYGNMVKYKERMDFKGQKESDEEKYVTYKQYFDMLMELSDKAYGMEKLDGPLYNLWKKYGYDWDYRL